MQAKKELKYRKRKNLEGLGIELLYLKICRKDGLTFA